MCVNSGSFFHASMRSSNCKFQCSRYISFLTNGNLTIERTAIQKHKNRLTTVFNFSFSNKFSRHETCLILKNRLCKCQVQTKSIIDNTHNCTEVGLSTTTGFQCKWLTIMIKETEYRLQCNLISEHRRNKSHRGTARSVHKERTLLFYYESFSISRIAIRRSVSVYRWHW